MSRKDPTTILICLLTIPSAISSLHQICQISQEASRPEFESQSSATNGQPRPVNVATEPRGLNEHQNPKPSNSQLSYSKIVSLSADELFRHVKLPPESERKRILVTGGAGFVGSHLVDSLMLDGHDVTVCDNFHTGRRSNVDHWRTHPNFRLLKHDVEQPLSIQVNQIYHLASPASPVHYMANPVKTITTNMLGTLNMLKLAAANRARVLIASTSEVYGDPEVHPQPETYWGHVNPIGPRSCYDESKRLSESLAVAFNSEQNVSVAIARIFNTYGPRMHPNDGRVISNFIMQTLQNQSLTVYGDGRQTRSFQYISDLVAGLRGLMGEERVTGPVNLGNPEEMSIRSLAAQVRELVNPSTAIVFGQLPVDDPHRRRPDIRLAASVLNWRPSVSLAEGLNMTIDYFRREIIRQKV